MVACSLRGTGCSCRGLEFDYKHPHVNIQHSVTSVPDDSAPSPGVEYQATTYTNEIKIKKSFFLNDELLWTSYGHGKFCGNIGKYF